MQNEPLRADSVFHPAPARAPRVVKRKTRITIYLDDEVLAQFRSESERCGKGYQTLINAALRHRIAAQRDESAPAG
jgi:uncharacterized protein (DUF4415 family)